jgi:hypothetical protein
MPNPTAGDVHVNRPLTQISIAYMQAAEDFVASRVFPTVPVQKQSDRYFVYDRADWFRDEMKPRAPSTESAGGGWRLDNTPSYVATVYALHKDIDDQLRANQDDPVDLDRDAAEYLAQQAMIRREKQWIANFFTTGLWTGDQTGVSASPSTNEFLQWNDPTSTPLEVVRAQRLAIKGRTGYAPNTLVVGAAVHNALVDHPDVVDRIKYGATPGAPAIVTRQALAALFEVEQYLVASAIETTSGEGAGTATYDFLAGKAALLVYAAPRPSILAPSGGYTFAWTGYLGAGPEGQRIKRFRMDHLNSDRIEMEIAFAQKLVAADLGVFFASAVA